MPDFTQQNLDELRTNVDVSLKSRFISKGPFSVERFRPATGIGCFDARYDVTSGELKITVKVGYEWNNKHLPWSIDDQTEFRERAIKVIEEEWSNNYIIRCTRPGWDQFQARARIVWREVPLNQCYFRLKVYKKSKERAGGGGIESKTFPMVLDCDQFAVQEKAQRGDQVFNYYESMATEHLKETGADVIAFSSDKDTIPVKGLGRLDKFARFINSALRHDFSGIRLYIYGATGGSDSKVHKPFLGARRATAVKQYLDQRLMNKGFTRVVSSKLKHPWLNAAMVKVLKTRNTAQTDTNFAGVICIVHVPKGTERKVDTKYIIIAHEFGHCLGLPDEYIAIQCTSLRDRISLNDLVPAKLLQGVTDDRRERMVRQQTAFADALRATNLPAPLFAMMSSLVNKAEVDDYIRRFDNWWDTVDELVKKHGEKNNQVLQFQKSNPKPVKPAEFMFATDSIMYSGRKILPAHYMTIWSALVRLTAGYLEPNDWEISPLPNRPQDNFLFTNQ